MENSNTVIPLLRFLGFSGKWKRKKIKDITAPAGRKNKQNLPYERYSISNETGFYPQADQFEDGGGYLKDIDCRQYIIVPPKSFAYNPARINVGSIGYQNIGKEVIVSSLYEVFQTNDEVDDRFLWQWFHTDVFHKMVLNVQEGGVRQYFFYDKLKECTIYLPSPDEQKKIAECLEAIDQMISAQNQKVESLKARKKGLMQQLFPQPGATTPALRFPCFTGEWTQYKLGECFDERNEQSPESSDYPLMAFIAGKGVAAKGEKYDRSALVKDASNKKYKRTELGDFIYSSNNLESGSIGLNRYGKACISPVYSIFKAKKGFDPYFIGTILTRKSFISEMIKYRQGVVYGQWKIPEKEFLNLIIRIPSFAEQQKIAEFLEAEDQMIAAQEQKVESLKTHKKGLMQQLFPQLQK